MIPHPFDSVTSLPFIYMWLIAVLGIYGLKRAREREAEINKAIEEMRREGKILSSNGRVTHQETRVGKGVCSVFGLCTIPTHAFYL